MDSSSLAPSLSFARLGQQLLAGGISGLFSSVLLQPLDVIKTNQQISHQNLLQTARKIYATEGKLGLFKGTIPSVLRTFPGTALYFAFLDLFTSTLNDFKRRKSGDLTISFPAKLTPTENLAIAFVSRSLVGVALMPLTVVKTRFEAFSRNSYTSTWAALKHIAKHERLQGLYRGLIPTILRDAPFSGLYYLLYMELKACLPPTHSRGLFSFHTFAIGLTAGFGATLATHPFDVIKTKMQAPKVNCIEDLGKKSVSLITALTSIYKQQGMKGYFAGLLPRLIRRSLMAAFTWTSYEQIISMIPGLRTSKE